MKKFFENFSKFWTVLFENKPKFYIVLNGIFGVFAIMFFIIQIYIGVEYIFGAIGWLFIVGQWCCIILRRKAIRRINNNKF
jgi:hypothetical protein